MAAIAVDTRHLRVTIRRMYLTNGDIRIVWAALQAMVNDVCAPQDNLTEAQWAQAEELLDALDGKVQWDRADERLEAMDERAADARGEQER